MHCQVTNELYHTLLKAVNFLGYQTEKTGQYLSYFIYIYVILMN